MINDHDDTNIIRSFTSFIVFLSFLLYIVFLFEIQKTNRFI